MDSPRRAIVGISLACLMTACGSGGGEGIEVGRPGIILAGSDTVATGIVVFVREDDGTRRAALFRGPEALASAATDGTWEIDGDSVPVRVRTVRGGERLLSRQ